MLPEPLDAVVHRRLLGGEHDQVGATSLDRHRVGALVREADPLLGGSDVAAVVDRVLARATGLGPLDPLLADPAVDEVMVNGPGPVWVERGGVLEATGVVLDRRTIEHLIEKVVAPLGLRVDRSSPLVDGRLPDGSRVNVIVPPLAVDGPCVTIRRFGARGVDLAASCPPGVAELLGWAVTARANVVVAGGAGAGKTTLLNALAAHLPAGERIVTVEDAAELRLPGSHVVRLEARPASAEGVGAVTVRNLVRNALRMRPDRIIVGECRGGEAIDMLAAMSTGHEGSLTTCHANSPADALRRLETMVLLGDADVPLAAVRDQLAAAVDLIVQVARRPDGGRGVVAVAEVLDGDDRPEASGEGHHHNHDQHKAGRCRPLADTRGLHALPRRPARRPTSPPDPAWVVPS